VKGIDAPAEFDAKTLPPIESIEAGSDVRAFLQRGVPPSLTRAALRRAWSADPAIRDFIGLSENAWDFNAPDSIPGFGSLGLEDVSRFVSQVLAEPVSPDSLGTPSRDRTSLVQSASASGTPGSGSLHEMREPKSTDVSPDQVHDLQKADDLARETVAEGQRKVDVAVQYEEEKREYDATSPKHRHGGALPE
jgi:hypothetical protein